MEKYVNEAGAIFLESGEISRPVGLSGMSAAFTVWIDGAEINSHLLTQHGAEELAKVWRGLGYSPVIEEVSA